jgi:predicted nuclease of predicted toxin-antitoxin system
MKFLVDAQLPPSLARFLTDRGHEAVHVFDLLSHDSPDRVIAEKAISLDAVVVTKDDDFVKRSDANGAPPQILWIRLGNCRNAALMQAIGSSLDSIVAALERGERVVEFRG